MSQFIEMTGDPRTNPKSWQVKTLSELATYSIGLTYKPENISEEGTIVLRSGNIQNSKIDLADVVRVNCPIKESIYVQKNDILMCSRNGSAALVGKVAQIKDISEPMTYGAFMTVIRSEYSDFLYLYFQSNDFREQVSTGKSSTMNQITQNMLDKISLPLPDGETRNKLSIILHQADKSGFDGRKSQFIEMFGTVKSTKPLTDFIDVSFPGEWGQEDKDGSGVKVIRTTNFTNNGKLDLSDVVTRGIDYAKVEKKKLSKGDIILERSGGTNDNPVGRVVYFEEDGVYLFNNFTQLLRCKEGVNSLFLFYSLFNYYQMNKNVIRSMSNKTTGIQNLKMDRYWQIPIADVSIERQKEFESIYRQADKSGSVLLKLSSR
ncbi:MAG: restriction endonuclease subunit S [Candidatus Onthomorpha sp.]|nr:restriction endonuclease subunit S [Candidatus Onthomorpha sp.]